MTGRSRTHTAPGGEGGARPTCSRRSLAIGLLAALLPALAAVGSEVTDETGPPEVIRWPASVGAVEFPHALHCDDVGVECIECHHETNASRLDIPHEDYFNDSWVDCQRCHRGTQASTQSQACSACHPGNPANIADESMSSKVVIHKSCWQCHEVGVGVEASGACGFCHDATRMESGAGTALSND